MDVRMKKTVTGVVLGLFFGLICAGMATVRKPVPLTALVLIDTVYTRTLAGGLIGLLSDRKKWFFVGCRGFVIGFLVSISMALPYGVSGALGFGLFGGVYGLIIDWVLNKT
ncbi:hypothetical protein J7K41_02300 [Candidatus Micrarchaeota archaeon]|nr:hypothetical protein [Candidatus Micrarchaeota archaeon]